MCHMLQNVAPCHLHGNQEGNNEHPGRKARANARTLAILGRFVTAERQQQSKRLRGIGARIQIWTAHGGVFDCNAVVPYRTAGSRRSQTTTAMMTNDRWLVEVILACCRRGAIRGAQSSSNQSQYFNHTFLFLVYRANQFHDDASTRRVLPFHHFSMFNYSRYVAIPLSGTSDGT
jgi:hypothetical protein